MANANGPFVGWAAALVEICTGAEALGDGEDTGVMVLAGKATVLDRTIGIVVKTELPGRVAVTWKLENQQTPC
jgi:hypothetical protein